jgi:hypothetical protein
MVRTFVVILIILVVIGIIASTWLWNEDFQEDKAFHLA